MKRSISLGSKARYLFAENTTITIASMVMAFVLVLIFYYIIIYINQTNPAKPGWKFSKQIQYSFTLQNKTNRTIKNQVLQVFAPVKATPAQYLSSLSTSHPYEMISDHMGNQVLSFSFENIAPYASKVITVKAHINFLSGYIRSNENHYKSYLKDEKYIEIENFEIQRLANQLKQEDTMDTVKSIFNWVSNNIKYTGYIKNDRGALYALKNKSGDCTEYMYLFIALCRANRIPARGVGGYICRESRVIRSFDYHNWAEYHANGKWIIADPQNKTINANPENYIAMRMIGVHGVRSEFNFDRFRVTDPGLVVKMN